MDYIRLEDIDVRGKRVLIREDLNVPVKDGMITSDQRIRAALPSLEKLLQRGAKVIVLSHMGRPEEGLFDKRYSLQPVADYLAEHLAYPVRFAQDYLGGVAVGESELILCENVRFNVGEKANDPSLAQRLAALGDIFVMDAFGTAHRAHASTVGVAQYAPHAVAGPLLDSELTSIAQAMEKAEAPIAAIVGGAKVSSKLALLKYLVARVDILIVGGGIANTFLKAKGVEVGNSLVEEDLLEEAKDILQMAKDHDCAIPLPTDVVVGKTFSAHCPAFNKQLDAIANDDMIMDIGPDTISQYVSEINKANTIIWNGPVGVFEFPQFAYGTRALAFALAESNAYSLAGGGDTLAAVDVYDIAGDLSYISTGGGAFLSCLEGKPLPAVAVLQARAKESLSEGSPS